MYGYRAAQIITINDILLPYLLYKTNRLRVAVGLMW